MIHCKPKTNTYVSLGIVIAILIGGLAYLLFDFYKGASFGLWFYLFSCTLITVILMVLLAKMMAGYKFISAGKNGIEIRIPFKEFKKSYPLSSILSWEEEKIRTNNRDFKQLRLLFDDQTSFSLSNHEHSSYQELTAYLSKKVPKKRLRG